MLKCIEVADPGPIIDYLRRDVLLNHGLAAAVETDIPPVPRRLFCATRGGPEMEGVMVVEEFPHGKAVSLYADNPESVAQFLQRLDPQEVYQFVADVSCQAHLVAALRGASGPREVIHLVLDDTPTAIASAGQVRELSSADLPLADRFPVADDGPSHPPLASFVAWAQNNDDQSVYGLTIDGEIVSFVQFNHLFDQYWDVGMIRTRKDRRRQGLAKSLLASASRPFVAQGLVLVYEVNSENLASLSTARAAGYREFRRVFASKGRPAGACGRTRD